MIMVIKMGGTSPGVALFGADALTTRPNRMPELVEQHLGFFGPNKLRWVPVSH